MCEPSREWRQIERDLVEVFRLLGFRPLMKAVGEGNNNGDWFLGPGLEGWSQINLSDVARELDYLR